MKNNNKNALDHLFKSGLEGQEAMPPTASWAQMEALLDTLPEKKKRVAAWWWAVAAALIPFLMAGIWWITQPKTTGNDVVSNTEKPVQQTPSKKNEVPVSDSNAEKLVETSTADPVSLPEQTPEKQIVGSNSTHSNRIQMTQNEMFVAQEEVKKSDLNSTNEMDGMVKNEVPVKPIVPSNVSVENTEESNVAQLEIHPGKPTVEDDNEVASIEWRPNQVKKQTLTEHIHKIRNGEMHLPTIGQAKENIFALLTTR